MVAVQRGGQRVSWEPAIFGELGATGAWDEQPFVDMIDARRFAFFVTFGTRGDERFDDRYNPAVADAIERAYPVKERIVGLTIHLPDNANTRIANVEPREP